MKIHYHSDHLGSASFVTDRGGYVMQHLQYLPYGELFVSQRNTDEFDSRYKFTAKELDNETSYTYFGARYYDSELSGWLSVDPMSDKYPSLSPYCYSANNPVVLVDPNGMDWYEVENKETQEKEIKWTDYKSQAEMNENKIDGTYLGEAVVIFKGSREEKIGEDGTLTGEGAIPADVTIYGKNGAEDIKTYKGLSMTSDPSRFSGIADGDYKAYYEDMATSPYGTQGAIKRGYAPALTYRIANLDGSLDIPAYGGINKDKGGKYLTEVFFHRTNWNGGARGSKDHPVSTGCPVINGTDWRKVEKQLGKSNNIYFRMIRN